MELKQCFKCKNHTTVWVQFFRGGGSCYKCTNCHNKTLRKGKPYNLNLNDISFDASDALMKLDDTFIGTKNYMGLTYFWDTEYKHTLRNVSNATRRLVHRKLLKANLNVGGVSPEHEAIIMKYTHGKVKGM